MIWKQVQSGLDDGDAVMVWKAPTDQGYDFRTHGKNRRMPVDFDGLKLVNFLPSQADCPPPLRPQKSVRSLKL
jgi:CRISPR-associated protein Cas2